ncbi:hypothetical protein HK097_010129 [Rhizophlyctis rosea]|uniref:Uncharacterized protein n=1 Tax=Rhizophlyctis rosea TaxID=64517 RepID=A0AAD5WZZ1_9FUNG|nr:hypothetical protein HK097_010129 [Rhizophlyctis rosea]
MSALASSTSSPPYPRAEPPTRVAESLLAEELHFFQFVDNVFQESSLTTGKTSGAVKRKVTDSEWEQRQLKMFDMVASLIAGSDVAAVYYNTHTATLYVAANYGSHAVCRTAETLISGVVRVVNAGPSAAMKGYLDELYRSVYTTNQQSLTKKIRRQMNLIRDYDACETLDSFTEKWIAKGRIAPIE